MNINVNLDAEALQARLVQAIIDSAIGENIKKYIDSAFTRETGSYGDYKTIVQRAIDDAITAEVKRMVTELAAERRGRSERN